MNEFITGLHGLVIDGGYFRVGVNMLFRYSEELGKFELGVFNERAWGTELRPALESIEYYPVCQSELLEECIAFLGDAIQAGTEQRRNMYCEEADWSWQ